MLYPSLMYYVHRVGYIYITHENDYLVNKSKIQVINTKILMINIQPTIKNNDYNENLQTTLRMLY